MDAKEEIGLLKLSIQWHEEDIQRMNEKLETLEIVRHCLQKELGILQARLAAELSQQVSA